MQKSLNRTLLLVILAGTASFQTCLAAPTIQYQWSFASSANPATPQVASGGVGVPEAIIAPGGFSDGWISSNAILGAAQGVWDLGHDGTILLSDPAGLAGGLDEDRLITVSVTQYQDGLYNQLAQVSVPGSALLSSNASITAPTLMGAWVLGLTQWRAPAGTAVNSIVIAGATSSLVDQITLEASFTTVPPPQLTIRRVRPSDHQLEVSWPASYADAVLEFSSQVNDPLGWAPAPEPVQVNGSVRFVILDSSGLGRLYRLRQPSE